MNNCVGLMARAECFACGLGTCEGCSSRILYLGYGVRRVCRDCQYEMARFGDLRGRRPSKCLLEYFGPGIRNTMAEAKRTADERQAK